MASSKNRLTTNQHGARGDQELAKRQALFARRLQETIASTSPVRSGLRIREVLASFRKLGRRNHQG
jgi:hypothetical protein